MSGVASSAKKAKILVYDIVIPGQNKMINSFGELIKLEQEQISLLATRSRNTISDVQSKNTILVITILLITGFLSLIVIVRIRRIQKELINSHQTLEKRVEERTKDMVAAKDDAEKANRAKTDFIATMSHEIRTPMNAIINLAYLTLKRTDDPLSHDYITKLKSSGEKLLLIINDILDFSKIESGKLSIESIDFNLQTLILDIIEPLKLVAKEKNITLALQNNDHDYNLVGDPLRLRQVLTNLLNNAIKFTKKGSVTLNVIKNNSTNGEIEYTFEVIDTGIGLTEPQIKMLFTPFQQADSSTTREYGGTGLGLIICKQLVSLMQGEINVTSRYKKGSTFSFTLPFQVNEITSVSEISDKKINLDSLSEKDVLLVEDNEVNRLIATALLSEVKIQTTTANNGLEALERLKENHFDLILMDIQMPEMDDYQATIEIKKNDAWHSIPIIALSANAMSNDLERSKQVGMDDHLSKPIDVVKLHKCLLKYLN